MTTMRSNSEGATTQAMEDIRGAAPSLRNWLAILAQTPTQQRV
jgi:hypothetical protein